jgi:peroxiredoxin (alkyl hydroperoxide reductase subunit C)
MNINVLFLFQKTRQKDINSKKLKFKIMSHIGKQIVDFKVQAFVNNGFQTVTKQDVLGKWSVFFFYPADFTFVCPTELEDLANKYSDFKEAGCEVYSVSTDTHFVHKAWHDTSNAIKKIQYPMLADPTGVLSRGFDVMIEEAGLAERGTFIVNPQGEIVAYEVVAGSVGRNAEELFNRLQALQFVASHDGEVCPAKWKKGGETLKPSIDLVGKI